MATLVDGTTCITAWKNAASLLLERGPLDNILVTISDPTLEDRSDYEYWNPSQIAPTILNQRDVANTIFPQALYERSNNRRELYARYEAIHARARRMRRSRGSWGTYFDRAINFGVSHVNQLELIIEKLNSWDRVARAALVLHFSSAETDRPRTRGGPCLQMVEFLQPRANLLELVAIYRSQDYCNRAFGNFIGLGKLLGFLCVETDRTPGNLVVHAIHAFYDGPLRESRGFLARR